MHFRASCQDRTGVTGLQIQNNTSIRRKHLFSSPAGIQTRTKCLEGIYAVQLHHRTIFVGRVGFEPTSHFRVQCIRLVPETARVPTVLIFLIFFLLLYYSVFLYDNLNILKYIYQLHFLIFRKTKIYHLY